MASLDGPIKQDNSSSEGEDISESAKLVVDTARIKKGSSGNSITFTTDVVVHRSPKKVWSKHEDNGTVLIVTGRVSRGQLGEDMEECLEDSETAKLLGSKQKLTNAAMANQVPLVTETKRKIIKVDQEGGKTEIIIERSETVLCESVVHNVEDLAAVHTNLQEKSEISKTLELEGEGGGEDGPREDGLQEKSSVNNSDGADMVIGNKEVLVLALSSADHVLPHSDGVDPDEAGSEVSPSDAATDSCEQDTDTYDLYQTVGSMTPNSLSNADVFRSMTGTVASSQATFISAEDTLGAVEETPASILSPTDAGSVLLESSVDLPSVEVEPGESTPQVDTETGEVGSLEHIRHASNEHTEDEDTMRDIPFEEGAVLAPIVMYPAQVHQYCPAGLEGLLDCGQLVIHRENLRHNKVFNNDALNRMEVIDISRKVLFYVEEEAPPLSEKSFLFKVFNNNKQEVMQIYNPQSTTCVGCGASWHCLHRCKFQTLIFAPLGQVAGFIKRSHTYFIQEYFVLNSQEEIMLVMRGGPDDLEGLPRSTRLISRTK